jgi:hypothetical protein
MRDYKRELPHPSKTAKGGADFTFGNWKLTAKPAAPIAYFFVPLPSQNGIQLAPPSAEISNFDV